MITDIRDRRMKFGRIPLGCRMFQLSILPKIFIGLLISTPILCYLTHSGVRAFLTAIFLDGMILLAGKMYRSRKKVTWRIWLGGAAIAYSILGVFLFGNPNWHRSIYIFHAYYVPAFNDHSPRILFGAKVISPPKSFSGTWVTWYHNGSKQSEGEYRRGKRHGSYVTWDDEGQRTARLTFWSGSRAGEFTRWYANGNMKSHGYVFGRPVRRGGAWCPTGEPEFTYDGIFASWYPNGITRTKERYAHGARDGTSIYWTREGRVDLTVVYVKGAVIRQERHHASGKVIRQETR